MASIASKHEQTEFGEPAWDIARLFPSQGHWSEEEYLALPTNRLVEFTHGHIEVLSMPTELHQRVIAILYRLILAFVEPRQLGLVLFASLPMKLENGKFREPDLLFMLKEHASRRHNTYWDGADLVIEVVSEDRKRDFEQKRIEYAQAGIPEYWIVDPTNRQITVLTLDGDHYAERGIFTSGQQAESVLLRGLSVNVADVFSAAGK